jgi:hypothetical protein
MVEAAAEANEDLMNKYLEEGDLSEAEIKKALRSVPSLPKSCRCCAVPPSRTRACRHAGRGDRIPAIAVDIAGFGHRRR